VACFAFLSAAPDDKEPVGDLTPRIWTITLAATVDGSGIFQFSDNELVYQHKHWQPPVGVTFNGQPWTDVTHSPDAWKTHQGQLDLSHAWIVRRTGRDILGLEKTKLGFNVFVADSPNGTDDYSITIAIPLLEQAAGKAVPQRPSPKVTDSL
jgi:hypothetical protein